MHRFEVEYTDTFGGEPNYSWVHRATVTMPELTAYGFDGQFGYSRAQRTFRRELMRRAKAAMGLTGTRGTTSQSGQGYEFRPSNSCTIMLVRFLEDTSEGGSQ